MIGLILFVAIWLLAVGVNQLTDRGSSERRRVLRGGRYGWALAAMAEFEGSGGRVQEISDPSATVRRQMRLTILGPFLLAAVIVSAQVLIGFSPWLVGVALAAWVFLNGALTWAVSGLFGVTDAEGERAPWATAVVTIATVAKSALVCGGVLAGYQGVAALNEGRWVPGLGLAVGSCVMVTYCYLPVAWTERLTRRRTEVGFSQETAADAILFLRSFADDDFRLYTPVAAFGPRFRFVPGRKRFEEFLAAALHSSGRLVAVGKPGETVPTLGAARTYWAHDDWKDAVQATAGRTRAILVMAGRTASLAWEMEQLIELGLTNRSLVIFPPDSLTATSLRHASATRALEVRPDRLLPEPLFATLTAMTFDHLGQPIYYLSSGRDWSSYMTTVIHFVGRVANRYSHEDGASISRALARAEDPFNLAAHLLGERHGRESAERLVADAATRDASAATAVGVAWAQLEIDDDLPLARRTLREAASTYPDDPLPTRALTVLEDIESGSASPRDLLRSRYPQDDPDLGHTLVMGSSRLRGRARRVFARGAINAQNNWEDWTASEALEFADAARALAVAARQPTAAAQADLWAATALRHLDRPDEARARYLASSELSGAPRTEITRGLRWIDPRDVVDAALLGLRGLALDLGDDAEAVAAAERLRAFRVAVGFLDKAATVASWLVGHHLDQKMFDESIRWGLVAAVELEQLGRAVDHARACGRLAQAYNGAEQHAEARPWAARAQVAAERVGEEDIRTHALFELARADRGLGSSESARDNFCAVFEADLHRNPWRARASLIRLGDIDKLAAVPLAREAAAADIDFYGPQSATRLVLAADATDAEGDPTRAASLRAEAVGAAVGALRSAEITSDDAARSWRVIGAAIGKAADVDLSELVAGVGAAVASAPLAALRRSRAGFGAPRDADLHDAVVVLGRAVRDRYQALLADLDEPTTDDLIELASVLFELRRALLHAGESEEALVVGTQLVAQSRAICAATGEYKQGLASCLNEHGLDLARFDRLAEAHETYTEAIALCGEVVAERGDDHALETLCVILNNRSTCAGRSGDAAGAEADLARILDLVAEHPTAPWRERAQMYLDKAEYKG